MTDFSFRASHTLSGKLFRNAGSPTTSNFNFYALPRAGGVSLDSISTFPQVQFDTPVVDGTDILLASSGDIEFPEISGWNISEVDQIFLQSEADGSNNPLLEIGISPAQPLPADGNVLSIKNFEIRIPIRLHSPDFLIDLFTWYFVGDSTVDQITHVGLFSSSPSDTATAISDSWYDGPQAVDFGVAGFSITNEADSIQRPINYTVSSNPTLPNPTYIGLMTSSSGQPVLLFPATTVVSGTNGDLVLSCSVHFRE